MAAVRENTAAAATKSHRQHDQDTSKTMADRERSRSRSPEGGAPPADDNQNGDQGGPPAGDAPPADAPADDAPAGDDGANADEVKLYVGNLDYGMLIKSPWSHAWGFLHVA